MTAFEVVSEGRIQEQPIKSAQGQSMSDGLVVAPGAPDCLALLTEEGGDETNALATAESP